MGNFFKLFLILVDACARKYMHTGPFSKSIGCARDDLNPTTSPSFSLQGASRGAARNPALSCTTSCNVDSHQAYTLSSGCENAIVSVPYSHRCHLRNERRLLKPR